MDTDSKEVGTVTGLFALSEAWNRTRYRALKAEARLKELRTLLHAKYHHNSQIADCLLKLEVTLYEDVPPPPIT